VLDEFGGGLECGSRRGIPAWRLTPTSLTPSGYRSV